MLTNTNICFDLINNGAYIADITFKEEESLELKEGVSVDGCFLFGFRDLCWIIVYSVS